MTSPTRYHHGDLRRALLQHARALVEEGGAQALTLRAAATAAGVSAAAPYRHFESLEALLAEVLSEGFTELTALTDAARQAAPDALESYLAVGRRYLQFAAEHPQLYRLMFGVECNRLAHAGLITAGQSAFAVVYRAAQDCAVAGATGPHAAQDVALAGWATVHGIASLHVDGVLALITPRPTPDIAQALLGILVAGLTSGAGPASRS